VRVLGGLATRSVGGRGWLSATVVYRSVGQLRNYVVLGCPYGIEAAKQIRAVAPKSKMLFVSIERSVDFVGEPWT
jgi:hypothetical protein